MTLPGGGTPQDVAARWFSAWAGGPGRSGWGGPGAGPVTPVMAPPYVWKPPAANDFNQFSTLTGLNAANTPAELTGATFQIPGASRGVIRSVALLANNLLVTSNLRWTLYFNDAPVPGWTGLTINPRAAGSVEFVWTPDETFIQVPEGATIRFVIEVLDAGTYQASIAYHGWYYPTTFGG